MFKKIYLLIAHWFSFTQHSVFIQYITACLAVVFTSLFALCELVTTWVWRTARATGCAGRRPMKAEVQPGGRHCFSDRRPLEQREPRPSVSDQPPSFCPKLKASSLVLIRRFWWGMHKIETYLIIWRTENRFWVDFSEHFYSRLGSNLIKTAE